MGLKPTFGEIPTLGVVPLSVSLDHVGPLARNVTDAWSIYAALIGESFSPPSPGSLVGVRLGKLSGYFLEKIDGDVRGRFEETLGRLRHAGASIDDIELGRVPDISQTYINVTLPEAFASHAEALKRVPDAFSRSVRSRLEMGERITRDDYVQAQSARAQWRAVIDRQLSHCDALVLPTLPIPPQKIGAETVMIGSVEEPLRPMTLRLTQLFNLTGHPAISLPCGVTRGGLPCGLQIVGRRQQTAELLQIARSCEALVE